MDETYQRTFGAGTKETLRNFYMFRWPFCHTRENEPTSQFPPPNLLKHFTFISVSFVTYNRNFAFTLQFAAKRAHSYITAKHYDVLISPVSSKFERSITLWWKLKFRFGSSPEVGIQERNCNCCWIDRHGNFNVLRNDCVIYCRSSKSSRLDHHQPPQITQIPISHRITLQSVKLMKGTTFTKYRSQM